MNNAITSCLFMMQTILLTLVDKTLSAGQLRLLNGEKRINHLWMSGYLSIFAGCK